MLDNPFAIIERRLNRLESLLVEIRKEFQYNDEFDPKTLKEINSEILKATKSYVRTNKKGLIDE